MADEFRRESIVRITDQSFHKITGICFKIFKFTEPEFLMLPEQALPLTELTDGYFISFADAFNGPELKDVL
nr:hypothetical protein [Butyrivibrio sp. AE3003]